MRDRMLDVINLEIGFHSDVTNPWLWRLVCRLFNKKECHEVLVNELKYLRGHLERMPFRVCPDCKEEFTPISAKDWWCKECLTVRYNSYRKFGIDYGAVMGEPEMTENGPGGS